MLLLLIVLQFVTARVCVQDWCYRGLLGWWRLTRRISVWQTTTVTMGEVERDEEEAVCDCTRDAWSVNACVGRLISRCSTAPADVSTVRVSNSCCSYTSLRMEVLPISRHWYAIRYYDIQIFNVQSNAGDQPANSTTQHQKSNSTVSFGSTNLPAF